mmetsp:Transcript_7922/g.16464  ORF Transcript_7922/g.16464 Transcript_7922/m.16464 type:complete len:229 (-) Transcript_7922:896-1582(-)
MGRKEEHKSLLRVVHKSEARKLLVVEAEVVALRSFNPVEVEVVAHRSSKLVLVEDLALDPSEVVVRRLWGLIPDPMVHNHFNHLLILTMTKWTMIQTLAHKLFQRMKGAHRSFLRAMMGARKLPQGAIPRELKMSPGATMVVMGKKMAFRNSFAFCFQIPLKRPKSPNLSVRGEQWSSRDPSKLPNKRNPKVSLVIFSTQTKKRKRKKLRKKSRKKPKSQKAATFLTF